MFVSTTPTDIHLETLEKLKSGQLSSVRHFKLSYELVQFPSEILHLSETLEILDLSGNNLTNLPNAFVCLEKLKIAFFSNNCFREIPSILSKCPLLEMVAFKSNQLSFIPDEFFTPTLRWLILTNNRLTKIPSTIGKCVRLQKLMLSGNLLNELPETMVHCQNLQLIRISANHLDEIPSWLFSLPKLSWLAFSGNPCCKSFQSDVQIREISWNNLTVDEQIGEGASGLIFKAKLHCDRHEQVAIKLFKGEITSDGLPNDEIHSTILAGDHENLIKLIGKLIHHPENKQGLIFQHLSSDFHKLGNPPDFDTCTRDTFPNDFTFSIKQIEKIISSICSVSSHLHSHGLMHSDLYAHNILTDGKQIFLTDFGAATHYLRNDTIYSQNLERTDVRAFGCLLEDLLERLDSNETNMNVREQLNQLKNDCLSSSISQRPTFDKISEQIANIRLLI